MANIELDISKTLELLENVNKAANIGIFQYDVETEKIYWNDVLKSIFDTPEDFEPSLDNVFDFMQQPGLKEQIEKSHVEAIISGKSFEFENAIITNKGNTRYTRTLGQPVFENGKCIYIQGAVIDITERKKTESELKKRNQQLVISEHIAQMGYWRWDTITNKEIWSDYQFKIFGRKKGVKPSYDTYLSHIHPDDFDFVSDKIEKAFVDKILPVYSHRIVLENGTIKVVLVSGQVITNKKGEVIEMLGTCQDITRIQEAELKHSKTNKQLDLTEKINTAGSWQLDLEKDEFKWTDNLYRILDFEIGTPMSFKLLSTRFHPDDIDFVTKEIQKVAETKQARTFLHRVISENGGIKTLEIFAEPLSKKDNEITELIGTIRDITSNLNVEKELKEKNNLLDFSEKLTTIGYWKYIPETNFVSWSDNHYQIFEVSKEEQLSFETYFNRIHPDDQEFVSEKINQSIKELKFYDFTHRIVLDNGAIKIIQVIGQVYKNNQNGVLELLGTCLDITESESIAHELHKKNQQMRIAEKMTMIGNWQFNTITKKVLWSDNLYNIYEHDKSEPVSFETYVDYIHEDDKSDVVAKLKAGMEDGKFRSSVYRIQLKDGTIKTLKSVGKIFTNTNGDVIEMYGTCQDITQSTNKELELLQKNKELSFAEKLAKSGSWSYDLITGEIIWSDNQYEIFGLEIDSEISFQKFTDFIHKDDKELVVAKFQSSINFKQPFEATYRIQLKDGSLKTFKAAAKIGTNKKGEAVKMLGTCQDITDSIKIQKELQDKNQQLNRAEQMASLGSWEYNPSTEEFIWSDNLYRIYGFEPGIEMNLELGISRVHPDDLEATKNIVREILNGVEHASFTQRIILDDGTIKTLEARANTITDKEGNLKLVGTTQDITESKKNELELTNKNEQLNSAEQIAKLGSWEFNPITEETIWSDNLYRIYGLDSGIEMDLEIGLSKVHTDDLEESKQIIQEIIDGVKHESFTQRIILDNGAIKTVEIRAHTIKEKEGTQRIIGTTQDITESKKNERELLLKNKQLNNAEQMAMLGSWEWQPQKGIYKWSENLYRIYGWEPGVEISHELTLTRMHPEDMHEVTQYVREILDGAVPRHFIHRIILDNGDIRTLEIRGNSTKDKDGNLVLIGTTQDITQAKKNELIILQKNQQLNDAEQLAMTGSFNYKPKSKELIWSNNSYRLHGLEIGTPMNWDTYLSCIHPDDVEYFKKSLDEVMTSKKFEDLTYRIKHKDGATRNVISTAKVITNKKGEVVEIIGTGRDITESKKTELEILQKNQQLNEAEQLAKSGSWTWHANTNTYKWSNNLYKLYDVEIGTPIDFKTFLTCVHPDDQEYVSKIQKELIHTKIIDNVHRAKHKDGTIITIEAVGKIITNNKGEIVEIIGSSQDITERLQKAQELLQKNQKFNFAEKIANIGSWQWDPKVDTLNWSDNHYRIFGFEVGIPMTLDLFNTRIHPEDRNYVVALTEKLLKTKELEKTYYRIKLDNGEVRTIEVIGKVNTDLDGEIINIEGTAQNITERLHKEQELLLKNQKFNYAEKIANIGSWQWDPKVDKINWSDNHYRIFGFEVGTPMTFDLFFSRIHPDDRDIVNGMAKKIQETKELGKISYRIKLDNDEVKNLEVIGFVNTDSEGNILNIAGTAQDITSRVETELEIMEKNQLLSFSERLEMIGSWKRNLNTNELTWSDNLYTIFNIPPDIKITSEIWFPLIHPDDAEKVKSQVENRLQLDTINDLTYRIILKNGSIKILNAVSEIIRDNKNIPISLIGSVQDVTESKKTEQELLQKNQKLNEAEQLAKSGSFHFKPNTDEFIWSDNSYRVHGFKVGIPMNFNKLLTCIHPDDLEKLKNHRIEIEKSKIFKDIVYRIKPKNGIIRTINSIGKVITNKSGKIKEVIGTVRDITESIQRERSLIEKNEMLNLAQELAMIGYWQIDLDTEILEWSDNLASLFDFKPGAFMNIAKLFTHIHPDDHERINTLLSEYIETKIFKKFSHRVVRNDGTIKTIEILGTVITNIDGEAIELIGSCRDITEDLRQKEELEQMNSQLKKAEELAMIGSFLYNPITDEFKWSNNAYRIYDFVLDTPINFDKFLTCIHPDDYKIIEKQHSEAYSSKTFNTIIHRIKRKNGDVRFIEAIGEVIIDEVGEATEIIGTCRDITEQKNSENKILETNKRLEKITTELMARNRQLADFNQITSHNLRAPVSNLSTLLELHNDESTDDALKTILFSKFGIVIDHLTLTLNTLIDSLKIKNTDNLVKKELTFDDTLIKTKEILVAEILKTGAIIKSDFLAEPTILYNEIYLESIFLNLIGNAIKYKSPDRIPEITILSKIENGRTILTIKDNGLGIDLKRHGDKLFGLNKVFHRHPDALGIGLFLTKAQIEAMGGSIYAESEVNVGTTFFVTLN